MFSPIGLFPFEVGRGVFSEGKVEKTAGVSLEDEEGLEPALAIMMSSALFLPSVGATWAGLAKVKDEVGAAVDFVCSAVLAGMLNENADLDGAVCTPIFSSSPGTSRACLSFAVVSCLLPAVDLTGSIAWISGLELSLTLRLYKVEQPPVSAILLYSYEYEKSHLAAFVSHVLLDQVKIRHLGVFGSFFLLLFCRC